jgi:hypothetical protein
MTVVSSEEFITDEDKYFDLALEEEVIVKKGDNMFVVQNYNITNDEPDVVFEPDDDFYRSITGEELKKRMRVSIHNFFENKR